MVETSRTYGSHPDSVAILPSTPGHTVEAMDMEGSLDMTFSRNKRDWFYLAVFAERFFLCFTFVCVLFLTFYYG